MGTPIALLDVQLAFLKGLQTALLVGDVKEATSRAKTLDLVEQLASALVGQQALEASTGEVQEAIDILTAGGSLQAFEMLFPPPVDNCPYGGLGGNLVAAMGSLVSNVFAESRTDTAGLGFMVSDYSGLGSVLTGGLGMRSPDIGGEGHTLTSGLAMRGFDSGPAMGSSLTSGQAAAWQLLLEGSGSTLTGGDGEILQGPDLEGLGSSLTSGLGQTPPPGPPW